MAMTLDQVKAEVEAWYTPILGTFPDPDGAYGAQCKDLISHYIEHVHSEPYTRGNGIDMARNLISQRGWTSISATGKWQIGDVVSLNWGGYAGHVYVVIEDYGSKVKMVDLNGGPAPANSGPDEAVKVRVTSKTGVVGVARPPRYVGATATSPVPDPAPTKTPTQILAETLYNAEAIVAASARAGVPLWVAAAMIRQESTGRNVFGNDVGGVFSTPNAPDIEVTPARYAEFYARAIQPKIDANSNSAGETSNGVGPAQITFWGYHRDAKAEGLDLTDPEDSIFYGLRILKGYLKGDYTEASVKISATRYNAGPSSTVVNKYGEEVWKYAVYYQGALGAAGTTDPGPTDPGTTEPPTDQPGSGLPVDPTRPLTQDPGASPEFSEMGDGGPTPLPDPPPGPLQVSEPVTIPLGRAWWRSRWWTVTSVQIDRELAIDGPDQAIGGAGMTRATGTVTLARPLVVSKRGWSPYLDSPPAPKETVWVDLSDDAGETWVRKFTGMVDSSAGSTTELEVTMGLTDATRSLAVRIDHPAVGARHPAPDDGMPYMAPGMHPVYLTNLVARAAGFYATPAATAATVMLSVPMMGSMWPEHGTLFASQTLVPKTATTGIVADSPTYVATPWGVSCSNVFSRYRPRLNAGVTGKMDRPLGLGQIVGPTKGDWCFTEMWWDRDSLMVLIAGNEVRVEVQQGWNTAGGRHIAAQRSHFVTTDQAAAGFDLHVWFSPAGDLSVIVDGVEHVMDPLGRLPNSMLSAPMDEVRVTSRPQATQLGGLVLVSSANRGDLERLHPEDRGFVADVDVDHMLWGMPALAGADGLELLTEQAHAEMSSMWIDEDGRLNYVGFQRMDARPSTRTLTVSDLENDDWQLSRSSVKSKVDVEWIQPIIAQNRFKSGHTQNMIELSRETLVPGQTFETIIHVPDDEDWIDVDGPFSNVGPTTAVSVNTGVGSWLGGTLVSDDDSIDGLAVPVDHYRAFARRVDRRTFAFTVSYTPPPGVTASMDLTTAKMSVLRSVFEGRGPMLRARGKQQWSKSRVKQSALTGAVMPYPDELVHDGKWFVQTQKQGRAIRDRLAQMLAQPIPSRRNLRMAAPDLRLQLGQTITLDLDGVRAPQRLAGSHLSLTPDAGLSLELAVRQLRP